MTQNLLMFLTTEIVYMKIKQKGLKYDAVGEMRGYCLSYDKYSMY